MNERSARATLGVSSSATAGQIKRAYRRQALACHPDHGGDPVAFARLVEAQRYLLAVAGSSRCGPASDDRPTRGTQHRRSWFVPANQPDDPLARGGRTGRLVTSTKPTVRSGHRSASGGETVASKSFGEVLAEKLAAA